MPSFGDRTGNSTLDAVLQRLSDAEQRIHALEGGHRWTIDRGDTNTFPVDKGAFEGQMMIQYDTEKPWYFSNGQWRPFVTSSGGLVHAEGRYQISGAGAATVVSGGSTTISWTHISGDNVLSLTNPFAPTPATAGWYTVDATFATEDWVDWTAGSSFTAKLVFNGARTKFSWNTSTIGVGNATHEGNQSYVGLSGYLRAGTDTITLSLDNNDSGSRVLTFDTIEVSMVYAATT